jgi:sulfur-oxidizing protein SoxZ
MSSTPIRIRARQRGDVTELLLLAPHPMETGLRRGPDGRLLPAHFIERLDVTVDGRPAFSARMSHAVSADPMLSLRLRGAPAGQTVRVSWTDNHGRSRSDEALIT